MSEALRKIPLALYFSAAFAFVDRALTVFGIENDFLGYLFLGLAALLAVVGLVQAISRLRSWYSGLMAELASLRVENDELIEELSDLITPSGGTAAYPLLKREELSETHIKGRTVYIADFAREVASLSWTDAVIKNCIFEDCYIVGPAVLVPMNTGDLTGHVFVGDDQWWEEGSSAFWAPTADPVKFTGIVGLEDCVFRDCRYKRVGILMTEEEFRRKRKEANELDTDLVDQITDESEEESASA